MAVVCGTICMMGMSFRTFSYILNMQLCIWIYPYAAHTAKRAGAGAAVPVASRKRTKRSDAEASAAAASSSKRRRGSKK